MGRVSVVIVGLLIALGCFAWAQESAVPPEPDATGQVQGPLADNEEGALENRQPMTDIHDIKPLVSVPVPVSWAAVALWVGICIVVLALLLWTWFLWRRRHRQTIEEVEALLSPEETALQRLATLSPEDASDGKAFYFQLSAIFREYLQGRFGIDGLEMTTEELMPHVEMLALDRDLKGASKRFILSCDPVKFAGVPAFQEAMAGDFAFVKGFVEKTAASNEEQESTGGENTAGALERKDRVSV